MSLSGVRAFRRAALTRVMAIWLVALAITPVTAPFSAVDQPIGGQGRGESVTASRVIPDEAPVASLTPNHIQASSGVVVYLSPSGHPVDLARSGPLVLRL